MHKGNRAKPDCYGRETQQQETGIVALQWWFGMHGFVKERPAIVDEGSAS